MTSAGVLNGVRCLRTPFGFLPAPGDLPGDCFLLISLLGVGNVKAYPCLSGLQEGTPYRPTALPPYKLAAFLRLQPPPPPWFSREPVSLFPV